MGPSNLRFELEKALWLRRFEGHGDILKHRGAEAEAACPAGMCAVIHFIMVSAVYRSKHPPRRRAHIENYTAPERFPRVPVRFRGGHYVAARLHGAEDSAARLKFPSRGMAVPDYFEPGVLASALYVAINADDVGSRVACGISLAVLVSSSVWTTLSVAHAATVQAQFADGKWADKGFLARMSCFLGKFIPSRVWYRVVETAVTVLPEGGGE